MEAELDRAPITPFKIPSLRWIIAGMLFLAAILNYIDRSVLGLLAPTIQRDLRISDRQYASVVNCFLVAYTISYLASGRFVDRVGERISMALFIAWWSVANALTGFATSLASLSVVRFLLGLGEAGAFTVAPKVVSIWFPPKERGLAVGLYSIGGSIGATLAPLLISLIAVRFGWRWVFAVTPVLAALWLGLWLALYRRPAQHPRMTDKERDYLLANVEPEKPLAPEVRPTERELWLSVLREPSVLRLMLARLLTDPVWYFYQFWMAKYLFTARHLTQKELSVMWMVFLAADIGFIAGGFFSGELIKRGSRPCAARLWVMLAAACVVPFSGFIPHAPTVGWVLAISVAVVCAHTSWLSNISALVVDAVPRRILGTSFGLIACGSALGGIFMNQAVSWLITYRSYADCFFLMIFLHPAALLLVWRLRSIGPGPTLDPTLLPADEALA